jgi:hypothetical protein
VLRPGLMGSQVTDSVGCCISQGSPPKNGTEINWEQKQRRQTKHDCQNTDALDNEPAHRIDS